MQPTDRKSITSQLEQLLGDDAEFVERNLNDFYAWMQTKGKNPKKQEPLSPSLSENYHARIDQIFRFVIQRTQPSDQTVLTHEEADLIIQWLTRDEIQKQNGDPYSETSKRKFANAMKKYFEWGHHQKDAKKWRPRIKFSDGEHENADRLNFEERWKVMQTAKEYGSLPSYYETSEQEREKLKSLVAQRLGKPKEQVTKKDWDRADMSAKVGSLVGVTLETGLIPIEIERARTDWYDPQRNLIKITKEDAGKDRPTTELPLTETTGELLREWLQERRLYEKYDGTNHLWLNRDGNPYNSKNLCYLLRRLCEEAGIEHENRKIVWYSLRHNMGQSIVDTSDLSEAHDQLRHDHIGTTKSVYGPSHIESRRQTIEEVNQKAKKSAEDPNFNPYADDDVDVSSVGQTNPDASSGHTAQKHIDVVIEDTQEDRVDLAQKLLSDDA